MDSEVAGWIIEFVVRQQCPSVDHHQQVVEKLLSTLPLPRNNDSRFNKVLLLHRIHSEASPHTLSPNLLHLLLRVRELELELDPNSAASDSIKTAFCAVAVDYCTRTFLDHPNALKSFWMENIHSKSSKDAGFLSPKLLRWTHFLQAATHNTHLRATLVSRDTRNEALTALNSYLRQAWIHMGPSFIGNTADDVVRMGGGSTSRIAHHHVPPLLDAAGDAPPATREQHPLSGRDPVEEFQNANDAAGDDEPEQPRDRDANRGSRFSLMDKKPSAHTYEWEEFGGGNSAGIAPTRHHHDASADKEKKKKRRWTDAEEDTLRKGVQKFGIGSWVIILAAYHHQFQGRTAVNLKDKWRNMTK